MIAACLYAATLPAFLCSPNAEPPPPPPARVISIDRPVLLAAPLPPDPEPEHTHAPTATGDIPEPWYSLAVCESGMNGVPRWGYNGSSGYDGGLQFSPRTWTAFGGGEYAPEAWQATPHQQIAIAERVLAEQTWRAWPSCSRKLGLR